MKPLPLAAATLVVTGLTLTLFLNRPVSHPEQPLATGATQTEPGQDLAREEQLSGNPATASVPAPKLILNRPAEQRAPEALEQFSTWAESFLTNGPMQSTARGEALAWKRREAMLELIQSDPKRALELTVPFSWRRDLPEKITRHFEQQVDGRGSLLVAMATDPQHEHCTVLREAQIGTNNYQAFVFGRRLTDPCKENINLHGIAIGSKLALSEDPIRLLGPDEAAWRQARQPSPAQPVCGVCRQGNALAGDFGGTLARFCSPEHLDLAQEAQVLAEGGPSIRFSPGDSTQNNPWSVGAKRLLYMRVNFPDDLTEPIEEETAYAVMDEVNVFYVESSYNQTTVTPTVTPLLTLPQTKNWYSTAGPFALLRDAREAAALAGYDTSNYELDIVCHTSVPDFDWGGLGFVGGKGTWLQSSGTGVTAHELGHNYGLPHGNFWDTGTNYTVIGRGENVEYGNSYDTMGAAAAGANHFCTDFKSQLGWLPQTAVTAVRSNGLYRIYAYDEAGRISGRSYAARVPRDSERDYWIEFRERYSSNPWLKHGVLVNWSAWSGSDGGAQLLDTTPMTPPGKTDAALVIGRTFSDPLAGVHVTPVGLGATGTNRWIDLQINSGSFFSNRPPKVKLLISNTNAAPGEVVHLQAVATDRDGDSLAYSWFTTTYDNDDITAFSTNNLPWTYRSWTRPGARIIRCVVSDMKGGVASANGVIQVGNPSGVLSGLILDTTGHPVEGVLVKATTSEEDEEFRAGYTDSYGQYFIAGLSGEVNLNPYKYGYLFESYLWTNPITLQAEGPAPDFIASAAPAVRIHATTASVIENDTTEHFFVLTHNRPMEDFVAVDLRLGGSATSGDYEMDPPLNEGDNQLVFPPGTNVAVISFKVKNDSIVENPESVSLMVVENDTLYAGTPGSATITIVDDLPPSQSEVSVHSLAPRVAESGMDKVTFLIRRTGIATLPMSLLYRMEGTATPGVDYPEQLGAIILKAGQTEAVIEFAPENDDLIEQDETVAITIQPGTGYRLAPGTAQATIVSDDVMRVAVYPTAGPMGENSGSGRFTFKRDGDLSAGLEIHYALSGTATPGEDYEMPGDSVTIPAGDSSVDVLLAPLDDSLLEGDESVIISVVNAAGLDSRLPASAMLRIHDDEKMTVTITATDPDASEPGEDFGGFEVSRGEVTNGPLVVPLIFSGLAVNGVDYVPLESQVVIPDGESSVTFELIVFDDLHIEPLEDVQIALAPSSDYYTSQAPASAWIADNDDYSVPGLGFTAHNSRFDESRSPGISVSMSATSSAPVTVEYRIIGGTAGVDDYALDGGTLTFEVGERAKPIPLTINDDSEAEADETIRIVMFNPSGASFDGIKLHTYTIADNDTARLSVSATAALTSESSPSPGKFRITRTGSTSSDLPIKIDVAGTAAAPGDYAPIEREVILPAGQSFIDIPVIPVDDPTQEFDEEVTVTLLSAPTASIVAPNRATVTIQDNDNDNRPVVSVSSVAGPRCVEGADEGLFTFQRTGPTTSDLLVKFTKKGTAMDGVDYLAMPDFIVIPAGQATATLFVTAVDDLLIEGEETVVVALTLDASYRAEFPSEATVLLQDNDQTVRVNSSDLVATEPGSPDQAEFTFTRFGTTNWPLRVYFSTSGTALTGIDYVGLGQSIEIPAGSLSVTLPVVALDDPLIEGPETVYLQLEMDSTYTIEQSAPVWITIDDDEPMFTISTAVRQTVEGSRDPAILTVTRYGDPRYEVTAFLTVAGSARYGEDYAPFSTNVLFTCGVMSIDLPISATNELASEPLEEVTAKLLPDPSYTVLSPSNAVVSITDAGSSVAPTVVITSPLVGTVFLPGTNINMMLEAAVTNADPAMPLNVQWSKVQGPNTFFFGETTNINTTVSFTNSGTYVLRLTADNEVLTNYAEVTVNVGSVELFSSAALHWSFDDGSGTNVADSSGSARDGIVSGPATWTTHGVLGGALELSGEGTAVREAASSGFLNELEAFTLSFRVKLSRTDIDQGLFTADDAGTNTPLQVNYRALGTCGSATNVFEFTVPSDEGVMRYSSAMTAQAGEWHHLTLCWSNGLAPALYINGQLDRPTARGGVLEGVLVNSPQFIVGRSWLLPSLQGQVDDVRAFNRAMTPQEISALAALPPENYGAIVHAGSNTTVQVTALAELAGTVTDDGQPNPPGAVATTWTFVSGPAEVAPTNSAALTNYVGFTSVGEYIFRLVADDGQVKTFSDVTITVTEPIQIDVYAADPEAAELGPDTGMFAVYRSGDDSVELTVPLLMSGSASNGVDFIQITNSCIFPPGVNYQELMLTPYLDDRTEGDEPFTLTVLSNAAYWVGNSEATVTIHDSPYGAWTVKHFTLEELTETPFARAESDFDNDSIVNFVEYAFNRHPRNVETNNPPVLMSLVQDPADGLTYLTIEYTRRVEPTDTSYEVRVSNDLLTWNTGTDFVTELEAVRDEEQLTERVKARLTAPVSKSMNQFVTVRVWLRVTKPEEPSPVIEVR